MQYATARLYKATNANTGAAGFTYLLIVQVANSGQTYQYHITTAQAKALGFRGQRTMPGQVVQGWLYQNGGNPVFAL